MHGVHQGGEVVVELIGTEGNLTDRDVDVGSLVETELDAACLRFLDRPGQVVRIDDGASLGVRHETTRAKHAAEASHTSHGIRGRNGDIKIQHAAFDLLQGLIVIGHQVGAGRTGCSRAFTLGEHQYADGLAQAVREHDHITHLLVRLAGV